MLMLGDILAVVAMLVGIYLTTWALIVGCGLLFETKSAAAQDAIEANGGRCLGVGSALGLVPGFLALVMMGAANPGVKLLGLMLMLGLLATAAIGGAGLARYAGDRIVRLSPGLPRFTAFSRAAAFVVAGSLVPVLGWFLFGPAALLACLGAGYSAIRGTRTATEPVA